MKKPSKTLRAPNQIDGFTPLDHANVRSARRAAVQFALVEGYITADILEKRFPAWNEIKYSVRGSVFKCKKLFQRHGDKISNSPQAQGRRISVWILTDRRIAERYLAEPEIDIEKL
jgi:hypothetical protein